MEKRGLFVLVVLLALSVCFTGPAFSYSADDLKWNGFINVYLDKASFSDSENISGRIAITNQEDYPIVGASLVFQLGQGEYAYPSASANDNIVSESSIGDIWVLPKSIKTIEFSLPKQFAGNYHLDVYSWVLKSKFVGSNSIFLSPQSISLAVTGSNGSSEAAYERAVIVRNETVFSSSDGSGIGPDGFPAKAGSQITGKVVVQNNSKSGKSALKVVVSLCDWSNVFCTSAEEKEFSVPSLSAGDKKTVDVSFNAPNIPSAYEINIKLVGPNGIESIYKNRMIVSGGTAKVRKVLIDGLADSNYSVKVLYSGSPDHFSNPTFENFSAFLEVFDENKQLEEKRSDISSIGPDEIKDVVFGISSYPFSKLCAGFEKQGVKVEEECFSVPLKALEEAYAARYPEMVKATWSYDESAQEFSLNLSKPRTKNLDLRIRIFGEEGTVLLESIKQQSPFNKTFSLPKENLTLLVDDFNAKRQLVIPLALDKSALLDATNTGNQLSQQVCAGKVCSANESCTAATYASAGGACCTSECASSISSEQPFVLLSLPLITWVAIFVAALAIMVLVSVLSRLRPGRRGL